MYKGFLVDLFAVAIRYFFAQTFLTDYFDARPEISNPVNSITRVKEGVTLYKYGISPYEGDMYHGTPVLLVFVYWITERCPVLLNFIFPICDLITAISLKLAAFAYLRHLQRVENTEERRCEAYKPLLITDDAVEQLPSYVKLAFLLNPLSIISCVAQTTTTLNNTVLAIGIACMLRNNLVGAVCCVALASYSDFYSFVLVAPVIVWFSMNTDGYFDKRCFAKCCPIVLVGWTLVVVALLYISSIICGDWTFLGGTYGFILSAEDLTPNLGLFWYFFTELFDQFRVFFTWVFQLNAVIYVAPMAVCLRNDGAILYHLLLSIIAVFKSYPSIGDVALTLSFLPALSHLYQYFRHPFVIIIAFIACAVLSPIMWYLWIHVGSANANFYFAITLLYSVAHIFLLTDVLYAHLRRNVHLIHGNTVSSGAKNVVVLK